MLRQRLVHPYEHVPNFSLMATTKGLVAEFSGLANFEERKRKSNRLMSFSKIVNQMGSFGEKRKKKFTSLSRFSIHVLSDLHSYGGFHITFD